MPDFKAGDKVTHPWTGDRVWVVQRPTGPGYLWVSTGEFAMPYFTALASEFTPWTPPRPSRAELWTSLWATWHTLNDTPVADPRLVAAQALAEAATRYAERLLEEQP